jgi:hypothetical protein
MKRIFATLMALPVLGFPGACREKTTSLPKPSVAAVAKADLSTHIGEEMLLSGTIVSPNLKDGSIWLELKEYSDQSIELPAFDRQKFGSLIDKQAVIRGKLRKTVEITDNTVQHRGGSWFYFEKPALEDGTSISSPVNPADQQDPFASDVLPGK